MASDLVPRFNASHDRRDKRGSFLVSRLAMRAKVDQLVDRAVDEVVIREPKDLPVCGVRGGDGTLILPARRKQQQWTVWRPTTPTYRRLFAIVLRL